MKFRHINYKSLNGKQQEIYNFQKIAGVLADYGFNCIKLADDWLGADFLAYHKDGIDTLKVQLKGRLTIDEKYRGKGLHIAFPLGGGWCLIEHDKLIDIVGLSTKWLETQSWKSNGQYHSAKPSQLLINALASHILGRTFWEIFKLEPDQWGLRGDPYLWQDMAADLFTAALPQEKSEVLLAIETSFRKITGHPISTQSDFYIARFDRGGISGGMISPKFWREQAVPMLLNRHGSET